MNTIRALSAISFLLLYSMPIFTHANTAAEPPPELKKVTNEDQLSSTDLTAHSKVNTTDLKIVSLAKY